MHAKYEVSISYGSKVIVKVKVDNIQTNRQTDRQTNKQTGQKQYAPNHSIRGHKNINAKKVFLSVWDYGKSSMFCHFRKLENPKIFIGDNKKGYNETP